MWDGPNPGTPDDALAIIDVKDWKGSLEVDFWSPTPQPALTLHPRLQYLALALRAHVGAIAELLRPTCPPFAHVIPSVRQRLGLDNEGWYHDHVDGDCALTEQDAAVLTLTWPRGATLRLDQLIPAPFSLPPLHPTQAALLVIMLRKLTHELDAQRTTVQDITSSLRASDAPQDLQDVIIANYTWHVAEYAKRRGNPRS